MKRTYTDAAERFAQAIKVLADNPAALENLESYLSIHFAEWLEKYANTPIDIAVELEEFSKIY